MSKEEGKGYEEYGAPSERTFEGVSTGPGASFERALHQAARAAAEAGGAGVPFSVVLVEIVPEGHNQWVRTYTVTIAQSGGG